MFKKAKKLFYIASGAGIGITIFLLILVPLLIASVVTVNKGYNNCGSTSESISVYSDGSTESNKKAIWSYLKARGLTDEATAGVMGNMSAESGFNPSAIESNGEGHGLIQWSFGRKTKLLNSAKEKGVEWSDLQFQLDYLWDESLSTTSTYRSKLEKAGFYTSNDVATTTQLFHNIVEGSADTQDKIQKNRIKPAKEIYNLYRGTDSSSDGEEGISGRIIWVGDSRTEGLMYAINDSTNNYWVCKSGQGYDWFVNSAISSVNNTLTEDDTIVFNLGVNDLQNADNYINKLNELVNGSWSKAKKVIILSVNPVDESSASANGYSVTNASIKEFNKKLKAEKNKKIKFVSTFASLNASMTTTDGVHYDANTYMRVYNIVRSIGSDDESSDTACESSDDEGITGEITDALLYDNYSTSDWSAFTIAGNPFSKPQCTYFAWSRFYQVYGFDSGARGNGKTNAEEIVKAHPDKFTLSSTPSAGAVFSYSSGSPLPQYGHVGFIEAYDGTYVWISEGNATLNGQSGLIWIHKESWASFKASHSDVKFAVPTSEGD